MNLSGKTAIVTGASSGIGTAFTHALVQKGATVYGLARRLNKLQDIKEQLGNKFIPVQIDITDYNMLKKWVDSVFDNNSEPDILINNAGLGFFSNVEDLPVEDWNVMVQTNLTGIFYLTRLFVPLMKKNPSTCHIINIASVAGLIGNPQISGYNATKFGVRGFSEALFKELRYDKIKVTCMFPGSIATEFFDKAAGTGTHSNMMQPADVANTLVHILETPDNFLINEITLRPLNPKSPEDDS
ncbi:MAG: SDR family oxidoreductase [Balneolaceae bacterium]